MGLDGLSLDKVKELELNNFKYIMENGFYGYLRSSIPPITCPAWISIFTGKTSGRLGLFDFFIINENYEKKALDLTSIFKGGFLWDLICNGGFSSGVISIPMVNNYKLKGFMVNNWLDNEKGNFSNINLDLSNTVIPNGITTGKRLKKSEKNFKKEIKIFNNIVENRDEDFLVTVFPITDRVIHLGNERRFRKIYNCVDKKLNEILERCQKNKWNLIIVSDHGGKKIKERFNINTWLKERGYLNFREKVDFITRISNFFSRFNINFVRSSINFVQKITEIFTGDAIDTSQKMTSGKIDFSNTKAFCISTITGEIVGIWLNKKDKYKEGIVNKEEEDKIKKDIKKQLEKERAIEKVWYKKEILNVDELDFNLPELIVKAKKNFLIGYRPMPNIYSKRNRFIHDFYGTIMGMGPDLRNGGYKVKDMGIESLTPTVLFAFGNRVPKDMDGQVKKEILSEKHRKRKTKYQRATEVNKLEGLTRKDEEKIKERLEKLGYDAK